MLSKKLNSCTAHKISSTQMAAKERCTPLAQLQDPVCTGSYCSAATQGAPDRAGHAEPVNRAELVAILVALQECRSHENECIATDSRCSAQKIDKHVRAPAQTKNDCHQPLLQAITSLIVDREKAGLFTKIMKGKSHIGIHGNEMGSVRADII